MVLIHSKFIHSKFKINNYPFGLDFYHSIRYLVLHNRNETNENE